MCLPSPAFCRLVNPNSTGRNRLCQPHYRAIGRCGNPGVPVLFGGNNLPPLVEIGLTDLPKSKGAMAWHPRCTPRDDTLALLSGVLSLGVPWHHQILAHQLTLSQPWGTDYAHLITTGSSGF